MPLSPEHLAVLQRCPLFTGLDPLQLLPQLGETLSELSQGQYLLMDGDRLDRVYVLLEGSLRTGDIGKGGHEFLYQQLLPGYLAGGEIVCTPTRIAPYHIYAAEPSLLWSCAWEDLQALPAQLRLRILENLMYFISNQNIRKYYKIEALSMRNARDRIMKYLDAQAFRSGNASFTIPMDRQAMANYLCINRSVLSHELKKLEAEGIITFRKNHFTLLG